MLDTSPVLASNNPERGKQTTKVFDELCVTCQPEAGQCATRD